MPIAVFLPDETIVVFAVRTAPRLGGVVFGASVRELLVDKLAAVVAADAVKRKRKRYLRVDVGDALL
jgi:hypothetical protein